MRRNMCGLYVLSKYVVGSLQCCKARNADQVTGVRSWFAQTTRTEAMKAKIEVKILDPVCAQP